MPQAYVKNTFNGKIDEVIMNAGTVINHNLSKRPFTREQEQRIREIIEETLKDRK